MWRNNRSAKNQGINSSGFPRGYPTSRKASFDGGLAVVDPGWRSCWVEENSGFVVG